MTQRLQMADGVILELPDGATPEAMDRAALDYVNSKKPSGAGVAALRGLVGTAAPAAVGALVGGATAGPPGAAVGAMAVPMADEAARFGNRLSEKPAFQALDRLRPQTGPFASPKEATPPSELIAQQLDKFSQRPESLRDKMIESAAGGVGVPTRAVDIIPQVVSGPAGSAAATAVAAALENSRLPPWLKKPITLASGVLTGMGAGAATRTAITPNPSRTSLEEQRILAAAQERGIPMSLAARTGNEAFRPVVVPGGEPAQMRTFTSSVATDAGMPPNSDLSPPHLADHFDQLGAEIGTLTQALPPLPPTPEFARNIATADATYTRRLDATVRPAFEDFRDQLQGFVTSRTAITPDQYAKLRSDMGDLARGSRDMSFRSAMGDLQNALDDLVTQHASQGLSDALGDVRRRYALSMVLDDAMGGGGAGDRISGSLTPEAFKAAVDRANPYGYARGRGDFNLPSRIGDMISARDSSVAAPNNNIRIPPWMAAGGAGIAASVMDAQFGGGHPYLYPGLAAIGGRSINTIDAAGRRIANSRIGQAYRANQVAPQHVDSAGLDALAAALAAARTNGR